LRKGPLFNNRPPPISFPAYGPESADITHTKEGEQSTDYIAGFGGKRDGRDEKERK